MSSKFDRAEMFREISEEQQRLKLWKAIRLGKKMMWELTKFQYVDFLKIGTAEQHLKIVIDAIYDNEDVPATVANDYQEFLIGDSGHPFKQKLRCKNCGKLLTSWTITQGKRLCPKCDLATGGPTQVTIEQGASVTPVVTDVWEIAIRPEERKLLTWLLSPIKTEYSKLYKLGEIHELPSAYPYVVDKKLVIPKESAALPENHETLGWLLNKLNENFGMQDLVTRIEEAIGKRTRDQADQV